LHPSPSRGRKYEGNRIEAILEAVVQSVTALVLGEVIAGRSKSKINKSNRIETSESVSFQENDISLAGDLGTELLSAYKRFIETKDPSAIEEYIGKETSDREITFVVELSRMAEEDVRIQFGKPVEYVVSSVREIDPAETDSRDTPWRVSTIGGNKRCGTSFSPYL